MRSYGGSVSGFHRFDDVELDGVEAMVEGLSKAVRFVEGTVIERTPLLGGDLRGAMTFHPASLTDPVSGITFNSIYARYQHELAASYRSTPGTSSKYLEGPFRENEAAMYDIVRQNVAAALA